MKMEPIVSSETSAIRTQTPGNYPKRNKLHEIYLLIKYIKSVLWRVAERLSYIQDALCLKVKDTPNNEAFGCAFLHMDDNNAMVNTQVGTKLTNSAG